MEKLDRSFEAALNAVMDAGRQHRELGSRRDLLLKKLVNIGYENQFSLEDRIKARQEVKEAVVEYLSQSMEEEAE